MRLGSLRARVIAGALLWTVGLLAIAHIVSLALLVRYPHLRLIAHSALIAGVAIASMGLGISQVRRGLLPFQDLRDRLAAVRDGRATRLTGAYPAEVQPLVHDLNQLLAQREEAIDRAIARAGDLAHGLKTPLAVLAQDAARARAAGRDDLADALTAQVERMRRQIDYHLAAARATASGPAAGQRTSVGQSAQGLARTLQRLYADRHLVIDTAVPDDIVVLAGREDLDEMLGNLLDNACRWATSRVRVAAERHQSDVIVIVDDDGPGVPAEMRHAVLQRGVRAGEAAGGSGLGLAIVQELAGIYGGTIALEASALGGLRARLTLPG